MLGSPTLKAEAADINHPRYGPNQMHFILAPNNRAPCGLLTCSLTFSLKNHYFWILPLI
jgi:hypothetical protein